MSWDETTLGEHIDLISGPAFKSAQFTENHEDVPLIKGENIAQGYIAWEKSRYWPRTELPEYEKYRLEPGDIVLAMDRPWIPAGLKWAEIQSHDPVCLLVQRVARLRTNDTLHQRFLKYLIASKGFSDYIQNIMYGVNVPHISGKQIKAFAFLLPDIHTQERIASILSAYDDLIENNRRRIVLLERAARLLYREWFVHFRFPGHETAKSVDGLPEGWKEVLISELADIFRGKSYRSTELGDGVGKPFINLKCFERGGGFRVSGLKRFTGEHKEQHIANTGDIVIAVTDLTRDAAVVAQAARVPRTVGANAVYSMDLVKAVPKPDTDPVWFYGLLRFSRFSTEVKEGASGATVLHLKPKHIENWKLPLPQKEICELFAQKFEPILQQVDGLELQNGELTKARDLLLRRLMDGRIPVKV